MINYLLIFFLLFMNLPLQASEVLEETHTQVQVREHPNTGKPFVSISRTSANTPFPTVKALKRPDYRMLDPKIKKGTIPYEGPVSDRKKVYVLAATLATIGTVGGVGIIAAAPAATGTGAAGGAGLYGAAGGAVAAGSISTALSTTKSNPKDENFKHVSEAKDL